jgi:hypothetical protein
LSVRRVLVSAPAVEANALRRSIYRCHQHAGSACGSGEASARPLPRGSRAFRCRWGGAAPSGPTVPRYWVRP